MGFAPDPGYILVHQKVGFVTDGLVKTYTYDYIG